MRLIRLYLLLNILFLFNITKAQSFNEDKSSLSNFIKRMYNYSPFEGVKVIETQEGKYFISVLSLERNKYSSQSTLMRVAQVKAQSQANTFFNGSNINSELIISSNEEKLNDSQIKHIIKTLETIRENSIGFVKSLELLTNFDIEEGKRMTFIFYKEIQSE